MADESRARCAELRRDRVMRNRVGVPGRRATLAACAAFERAGERDDVHRLCQELARVEGWSPVAIRFWLAKLWGDGLVELARTRLTPAGWGELVGGDGDGVWRAA